MNKKNVLLFTVCFVTSLCIIFLSVIEANPQNTKLAIPTTLPEVAPSVEPKVSPVPTPTPKPNYPMGGGYGSGIGGTTEQLSYKKGPFKWERVLSTNENFSVELPSNFEKFFEDFEYPVDGDENVIVTGRQTISSFLNDTIFIFDAYKTKNGKKALSSLRKDYFISNSQAKCADIKIGDLKGMTCELRGDGFKVKEQYFYDKEFVYITAAYAEITDARMLEHFISSAKYNESKINSDSEELQENASLEESKVYKPSETAQKARLVLKQQPIYTYEARQNQIQGVIRISAILRADGFVSGVRAITSLPDGLTERAISATKRIKFMPAEKDGKRVSQYVTLEYNFRIY